MFGTNDSSNDEVKFGLARGDLEGSEARYTPNIDTGYGWAPGDMGVDVTKKEMDVLLPSNVATMLEGLAHGRKGALEGRAVKDRYGDPFTADAYGSGASEYYTSREALLGTPSEYDAEQGKQVFNKYLAEMQERNPRRGIVEEGLYTPEALEESAKWLAENASATDRGINTLKAFGSTFVSELLVNPADALGDATGLFDIGTNEEKTKAVNDFFGYNPKAVDMAMEEAEKQLAIASDESLPIAERMKAAGSIALEAFLTPEMLGTSLGALMAWVIPGAAIVKGTGVGAKLANISTRVDKLVDKGKLSKLEGRGKKLKSFMSADGAKTAIASQAGFIVSSLGNVNNQYEEFVQNNNGVELEGSEKAKWFAGRFAVQMINQNLDKLIDFNIIKNPGAIAAVIPAVKAMTEKEFAKVAKTMGKGVVKTAENMGKEAVQEYSQTMMELFNSRYGSAQFDDVDKFTDFITDERNTKEAALGALLGAGGAPQFELLGTAGQALGIAGNKAATSISNRNAASKAEAAEADANAEAAFVPTVEKEETITEEEAVATAEESSKKAESVVAKYASLYSDEEFAGLSVASTEEEALVDTPTLDTNLAKDKRSYSKIAQEIEEAEAVIESRANPTEEDKLYTKILRKAKRQAAKNVIDSKEAPTLGSGYNPEDVIVDYIENTEVVDGSLDISPEEIGALEKYALNNDIPALRFKKLTNFKTDTKDASVVQEEIFGENERSATTYRRQLRNLVNTPNVSRKAVAEVVGKIDYFLNTQENRKTAFETAVNELEADIRSFNASVKPGTKLTVAQKAQKKGLTRGKKVTGYDNFIAVSEDKNTGKLTINPSSMAIVDSINDNINFLNRTKTIYGSKVNNILGQEFTSSVTGIDVRPNPARQESRDQDLNFYDTRQVTKAIVDDESSKKQWSAGGDYLNDNKSKVNTGQYTDSDVVIVHSTAKQFKKGNNKALRKEIEKAYKAGATVIIDREVASNQALANLLNNYHFAKVKVDGVTKYLPKTKAEEVKSAQSEVKAKENKDNETRRKLIAAIETGNKEDYDEGKKLFGNDDTKVQNFYDNVVAKKTKEFTERLLSIAITKGFNSVELNDVMTEIIQKADKKEIPRKAVDQSFEALTKEIEQLEKGEQNLTAWKEAQEASKRGDIDLTAWIKENVPNAMKLGKDLLNNAVAKGRRKAYVYYNEKTKDFSKPTTNIKAIPTDENGVINVPYQVLDLDPNEYLTIGKATALNSFTAEELRVAGKDNIAFNQLIAQAKSIVEKTISDPKLEYGNTKNSIIPFTNSQVSSLIFDKDKNVNENVAIAVRIGLFNFVKNNTYLLKKGKKSKKDLAEILGIDESQLSRDAVEMMSDKGLLYKTAANSIGKDIASMLGLSRKSDSEADIQAYDALLADLGQTALLTGVSSKDNPDGFLELDNSVSSSKFAKTVLNKANHTVSDGTDAKVLFIQVESKKNDQVDVVAEEAASIVEILPDTDVNRKEPSFKRLSSKLKDKLLKKIRKEKLGLTIPDDSKKALNELMDTEWSADLVLMREMIENQDLIKARLGYLVEGDEGYEKLSYEKKEVQESINRGLDNSFKEMEWLVQSTDEDTTSLWFEYFFSKNGRFFIDSNTINPQNDKHLHRFTVQPKTHTNTFVYNRKTKEFTVEGKKVTDNVFYAIAQGFGQSTDKQDTKKNLEFGKKMLNELNTLEKIADAKKNFLEGKKDDLSINIEHLGHALQTFSFLEKVVSSKGKPFSSAITAEFDAVTSGFGLKNLQMPIIAELETWLEKVGILASDNEALGKVDDVSMNDILDKGEVKDSYQTLASSVENLSFEEVLGNTEKGSVIQDSEFTRGVWGVLSDVLPKKADDETISGALRSLFKYPFMTFNYSASIQSIRKNLLTGELLSSLADDMAAADLSVKDAPIVMLMEALAGTKGDVKAFQSNIRTKPFYTIKVGKTPIDKYLGQMIDASYGAQVEQVLTAKFQPFVNAQSNINDGFKAAFEIFAVAFEEKLNEARKKGAVSVEVERKIYEDLKQQWPMIKGPLSNMEEELATGDGIGVYGTQTSSPYGIYGGRKPSRANLSDSLKEKLGQNEVRVSQMVKQMIAAVAAGSVVPIHYIDGAIMAQTINDLAANGVKGITSIHDAIMPSLVHMGEAQKAYNKQTVDVNASYSFVNELLSSLDRLLDTVPLNNKGYTDRKVLVDKEQMPAKEFLLKARNDLAVLVNDINESREGLFSTLNEGAKVMHMAGTPDGVYEVEPGSIEYKAIEKYSPRGYNNEIVVNKLKTNDLNELSQNICK